MFGATENTGHPYPQAEQVRCSRHDRAGQTGASFWDGRPVRPLAGAVAVWRRS